MKNIWSIRIGLKFVLLLFCLSILGSCKSDNGSNSGDSYAVNVRLSEDPERINPNLSRNSSAKQVENMIFLPMAEYHPQSFELTPVLAKSVPVMNNEAEGKGIYFEMEMKDEAVWEDGSPVTGRDYAFTIKSILNPKTQAAGLRSFFLDVLDVEIDAQNPKKFIVRMAENNILAITIATNFQILPSYVYDPQQIMSDISFMELRDGTEADTALSSKLEEFALDFNSAEFSRDIISGAGAYKLVKWESNQAIQLERKENWWGNAYAGTIPNFSAYPQKINYLVIADQQIALSALKDGQLDVMGSVNPRMYFDTKESEDLGENLNFTTASLFQTYYLVLNSRDPLLSDKRVRRALAHLLDIDQLNKDQMNDIGKRTVGPIHPSKRYYNKSLSPISFDIDKAKQLLDEAGWIDSNNDGIRDKSIGGVQTDLKLDLLITNQELGKAISLMMQENGSKAGIEVNTESKEFSLILQDMDKGSFHMTPLRLRSGTQADDLYSSWHRSGIRSGGRNFTGFGNDESDQIIEEIRSNLKESERDAQYLRIQEIIYDEQPAIFLFCPSDCIINSNKFEVNTTSRRPGYFENDFSLAKEPAQ